MLTFTEQQLMAWITPVLWPFLRTLALFSSAPVLSVRSIPVRAKIGLAFFVALAAQVSMPAPPAIGFESAGFLAAVVQQLVVGLAIGFAVRLVFAAIEYAGELIGLQMGLGFAAFFDPGSGGQTNAVSRLFGTTVSLLFVVINGHLVLIAAVIESFHAFPVSAEPMAFLHAVQLHTLGAEVFRIGVWIALPIMAMLLFINLILGVITRVAQQMNIFAIGFPITLSVGLVGVLAILPLLEQPFTVALEQMLSRFQ
ncbi:flagellar biosynthetic protein FliR [Caldimonas thermodepolymerans]|uniref:Flagellar biosynthetic protein FliR n=1 Tax=Caldimonas thermodepolymerans TaxID=215580 RepID=A0A2S5T0N6_9BURK|nr:flagellar biosynthetic protein FliR [Caldimonas thermodepolymerans]PPE68479.1 flagellar biosynthetic protein FliR [Caldimonas thermodepolymerans]QPC30796.1 flagellar biosynthetic protein FliR [Caldimonas thermodepolymerans]RDI02582.1 flagellar biosynthetic protein FliR [Caldimonas thermodepolymerans]